MTSPEEGVDFQFIETDDKEVNSRSRNPVVEIMSGLYEGAIAQYGKIEFHIDETPPKLKFDFAVLSPGIFTKEELMQDSHFKNLLGDIIVSTVERMSQEANEGRNDNTKSLS